MPSEGIEGTIGYGERPVHVVHVLAYSEENPIPLDIWDKTLKNSGGISLPVLQDQQGKLWIGLRGRSHLDLSMCLQQNNIEPSEDRSGELAISIDSKRKVQEIRVAHELDFNNYTDEKIAKRVLRMVPAHRIDRPCLLVDVRPTKPLVSKFVGKAEATIVVDKKRINEISYPIIGLKSYPGDPNKVQATIRLENYPRELRE